MPPLAAAAYAANAVAALPTPMKLLRYASIVLLCLAWLSWQGPGSPVVSDAQAGALQPQAGALQPQPTASR